MNKKTDSIFKGFTNLYSLSKTLRFELKPVGETQKMLEEVQVIERDETIHKKYEVTKPYFDRLHREFVKEALCDALLPDLKKYFNIFKKWKSEKKANEKEFEKIKSNLRDEVVKLFNLQGRKWAKKYHGLKNNNIDILFEEAVFKSILKEKYGNDKNAKIKDDSTGEIISIFDSWKGFTGYFDKFFETRKNLYKSDGKSTALATRIIDQNLNRFCDNLLNFEIIKRKIDYSKVEHNFKKPLDEVFCIDFYNRCLLQDGIDYYNKILGGKKLKNGNKLKGLNELINLYRQKTGEKISFLNVLDKQILSEKEKVIDEIETEQELFVLLKEFLESAKKKIKVIKNLINDFVNHQYRYNLSQIYILEKVFNPNSCRYIEADKMDMFQGALNNIFKKNKISIKKNEDGYSFPGFIALSFIKSALEDVASEKFWKERYYKTVDDSRGFLSITTKENIWMQFLEIFNNELNILFDSSVERYINKYNDFEKNLQSIKSTEEFIDSDKNKRIIKSKIGINIFLKKFESLLQDFKTDENSKIIIKNFADSVLTMYQIGKYFAVEKNKGWITDYELDIFYTDPEKGYLKFYEGAYEEIVQVYNKLRNYLTRKLFIEEKWKLNFENPTLADGWDKNKERSNSAVILRKDGRYFLGLIKKGHNNIFTNSNEEKFKENLDTGKYEKMVYKFNKDVVTGIPKSSTQVKEVIEHFKKSNEDFILKGTLSVGKFITPLRITREIFDLNNKIFLKSDISKSIYRWDLRNKSDEKKYVKSFQKEFLKLGGNPIIYKNSIKKWLYFCFQFLKVYPSSIFFNYSNLKSVDHYKSIDECYNDMNKRGYKVSFQDISEFYINEKNKKSELYLFEISNKDWNKGSTKIKNLHTLYFKSLFSDENINQNFPFKLNGQAEIFYRPKTQVDKLGYKKDKKGKLVVNHKRYNENKIFLHIPITMNRTKSDLNSHQFNILVNNFLANNPDINIIGIDRGEKHLAYYSIINQEGDILESGSLNEIMGVNYAEKLEEKARKREQARKDWQEIEGIKDLKKGYISQVVRKLADLAIQHNAIIVFEDLNMRFKQIRGGIEKSIYQQLEKALIEKFNFLVNKKEIDPKKAGHLLNAYQLTAPFITFSDMGKQTGIIFYTQAAYTSKIDPVTGWRPNLYLEYSSAEKVKKEIEKFSKIEFIKDRFQFTYDIKKFKLQKEYPKNTIWTVCSNVERFRWDKKLNQNNGGYVHFKDMTENFNNLFKDFKIDISENILDQIKKIDSKGNEEFFRDFIFLFNLICQIRNTDQDNKDINKRDFILSPVEPFFDSRKDNGKKFPKNGDDNGAYNIARKGIIILRRISRFAKKNKNCEKMKWKDLYISDREWDEFVIE